MSVLFINVCKIVIDIAICAQLILIWVEIKTYYLTCSFCVCFMLCMLLMRILYSWLIDWDMSDDVFTLHVLHVVYALCENLVSVISLFQLKLKLRCIWWLCCQIYSLCEKVIMNLWEDTASNNKKRRWAMIKKENEQQ